MMAGGMEAENDFGTRGTLDAEALGADGNAAIRADPEGRADAPNIRPPRATRGWAEDGPGVVQRHHVCADGLWVHVSGGRDGLVEPVCAGVGTDRKSTRLNSSHLGSSYA